MRITRVIVKDLFNLFNHEIPFNLDEGVTIIHGPNGFGKTVILNMIFKIFHSEYYYFYSLPFDQFILYFDNGSILTLKKQLKRKRKISRIEKKISQMEGEEVSLSLEFEEPNKPDVKTFPITPFDPQKLGFPLGLIDEEIPDLQRIGPKLWYNSRTQEKLSLYRVLEIYGDELPINREFISQDIAQEPPWLKEIKNSVNIHLIETQRLLRINKTEASYRYKERYRGTATPVVIEYSRALAQLIEKTFARYGAISQSLDRTFPLRSLEIADTKKYSIPQLKDQLIELESKRFNFEKTGVLDAETKIDFDAFFKKINSQNKNMISVYLSDTQNKLAVLDDLYQRISEFKRIINSRFLYKQMSVNRTTGYSFTTNNGEVLPPNVLSSGEQNELILFFDLLFNVSPNSLILIDEPELSLHVDWQEKFLNDLLEITKIRGFSALIATHSPEIINNRWNLTVELEGPAKGIK
jgi:predicted ATP-binding protein involved in virulence